MRHADGNGNHARRYAYHVGLASYVISGLYGQIPVGGGQHALFHRHAGLAFGRKARITDTDGKGAYASLHRLKMDSFIFVLRHIPLMGCQGHTAAFQGRIFDRNDIQFVQMIDHVRHVHGCRAHRTAASV